MKKKETNLAVGNTEADIKKELLAKKEKVANLKFDLATGKVKNIREIRHLKKDIARLLTLLSSQKKAK